MFHVIDDQQRRFQAKRGLQGFDGITSLTRHLERTQNGIEEEVGIGDLG
jgi:hypothetical protein